MGAPLVWWVRNDLRLADIQCWRQRPVRVDRCSLFVSSMNLPPAAKAAFLREIGWCEFSAHLLPALATLGGG